MIVKYSDNSLRTPSSEISLGATQFDGSSNAGTGRMVPNMPHKLLSWGFRIEADMVGDY